MNYTLIAIYCASIAVLLLLSAFFSGVDTSYSVVSKLKLEKAAKTGGPVVKRAYQYALNYDKTIATILFGNSLVNILATSIGTLLAAQIFGNGEETNSLLMSLYMLLLIITFGEIIPKVVGRVYAYRLAILSVPLLRFFEILFFPIVYVTTAFANWVSRPFLEKAAPEENAPSDEELQSMVEQIEHEGIIDSSQSELLHRSIEFKETSAHEIMTPRVDIKGINYTSDLMAYAKEPGVLSHSRLLVYKHDYDHIVGYIPTKVLLKELIHHNNPTIDSLMLPVIAVPETLEISSILRLMKQSHHHIAVVKDEYGGTAGILTLEDILEELVGELYDESENVKEDVVATKKKNVFLVRGKMPIDNFFERFHLNKDLIEEDYDTVSGWINDKLGKFATEGDHFGYESVDVKVNKATPYTVKEAEITYHPHRKKADESLLPLERNELHEAAVDFTKSLQKKAKKYQKRRSHKAKIKGE
jgi:putative hemolysin